MSDITKAIQALCDEKNLSYDVVLATIETALAAAYRKDFGNKQQNIRVKFNPETGDMQAWDVKTVVEDIDEEVLEKAQVELAARREKAKAEGRELTEEETADLAHFNPKLEMMIKDAKFFQKKVKVGETLEIQLEITHEFGRMAAQTAKQVIIQKLREAERGMVFEDFKKQENQIIVGSIQRVEGRKVLIDIGKVTGVLLSDQQINREHYKPGAKMKFYVMSVNMTARGPEILLSRNHVNLVKEVFTQEIPEIADGTIIIKGVARDAGWRSKVAVWTSDESIDPIGSCIGQRGSRINTIIEELGGEKIDVIAYNENAGEYVAKGLSPAKVLRVELEEKEKLATALVAPDQFSLAIGRGGQNVRLASELTGWKIKVKEEGGTQEVSSEEVLAGEALVEIKDEEAVVEETKTDEKTV
ncbi:MAG: transcription termination factor NusA [Candidatus Magasanikbacteria bacterium]